ncbi:MAG TPA: phage tail sheath C-terminal domain-containing protein [Solirubrobacteraceae bacterium]|nr:phage tail sheath C-terminal domain-containing protein [Solirubrobacteraceae bacterium]
MAVPTYPGVYVEEVAGGARPIQAVGTSTPAFVGLAERGPDDEARRITSWTEYQRHYGSFIADGYLAQSVFQFFNNGGQQCYVVRVTRQGANGAKAASVRVRNLAGVEGVEFAAKSKGAWGNRLVLTIEDGSADPANEFKLTVRREHEPPGAAFDPAESPALEVHDDLSMDPDAPNFVVAVLRGRSGLVAATALDSSNRRRGRHRGGGRPSLPLGAKRRFRIDVDGDGPQDVELPEAVAETTDLVQVAAAIEAAVRGLTELRASTPDEAFAAFSCTVEGTGDDARLVLQSGTGAGPERPGAPSSVVVEPAAEANATRLLKLGESGGGVAESALAVRRPEKAAAVHVGDSAVGGAVTAAQLGSDGTGGVTVGAFAAAFRLLDSKTDFSLLAVPGENTPPMVDAGLTYCANRPLRDVFYLGETQRDVDAVEEVEEFRKSLAVRNSYGALYFPWIKALDPSGVSAEPVLLPPSGYVAGLYARTDANRGVWKAPAGTEAGLGGAVGLAVELSDVEHGTLNSGGVNVIRRFPTAGIVSFGARTITNDPQWTYVPVRRTAIMLRVSVYHGIQWAVFEPNDETLWSQLRLNVGSFMTTLFRRGAFQGATPSEAFFVKCDAETTTQADIDLGVVNVLLGFAPLKPAEFVVVRISQKAGQAA